MLRLHDDSLEAKVFLFLSELIKYVRANQGALFVVTEQEKGQNILDLKACYAYGKRKYIHKQIYLGEGLVGQAYQEKERIFLTDVPPDYIKISSGLGQALPTCVLIIPLLSNDQVVGVLEMASFELLEEYQIQFIEKVLENLSATLVSAQINAHTKSLLKESLQRTEQMRAQEEEMRQNMEELAAIQEEMLRGKRETEQLLTESRQKEETLKQQEELMRENLEEIFRMQTQKEQEIEALRLKLSVYESQKA